VPVAGIGGDRVGHWRTVGLTRIGQQSFAALLVLPDLAQHHADVFELLFELGPVACSTSKGVELRRGVASESYIRTSCRISDSASPSRLPQREFEPRAVAL